MEYVCTVDELGGVHGEYDGDERRHDDGERSCGDVDGVWVAGCGGECEATGAAGCWGEGTGGCWGGGWGCGFGGSCDGVVRDGDGDGMEGVRSFGKAKSLVAEFGS